MTVKYHKKSGEKTETIKNVFSFVKDQYGDTIIDYWEGTERKTIILRHKDLVTIWV